MKAYLQLDKCEAGMFPSERSVLFAVHRGVHIGKAHAFVDQTSIVHGRLEVSIIHDDPLDDRVLIQVPEQDGSRHYVLRDALCGYR